MPSRAVRALILGAALGLCGPLPILAGDGRAEAVGRFTWRIDDPRFGGLSGLELSPDGLGMTAITDQSLEEL